jgi:hypothetical protein
VSCATVSSRLCQAFGARGAAVIGADLADEAGQVVQDPAQPVEPEHGRVDRPAGEFGVTAQLSTGLTGHHPQVALGPGQADGVPVDQHHVTAGRAHDVARMPQPSARA